MGGSFVKVELAAACQASRHPVVLPWAGMSWDPLLESFVVFVDVKRRCHAEQRPVGDRVAGFPGPHSWSSVNLEVPGEIL